MTTIPTRPRQNDRWYAVPSAKPAKQPRTGPIDWLGTQSPITLILLATTILTILVALIDGTVRS